jgi:hypothetical protein
MSGLSIPSSFICSRNDDGNHWPESVQLGHVQNTQYIQWLARQWPPVVGVFTAWSWRMPPPGPSTRQVWYLNLPEIGTVFELSKHLLDRQLVAFMAVLPL